MIGNLRFEQVFGVHRLRKQRFAAAVVFLLGLGLQCFDLHAALLFRSLEQVDGQQRWSSIKKYSNPSDTAYARVSANGVDEVHVFLSGEITHADVASMAVMENLLRSGRQKIAGNTMWFSSNGGDIDAGMELARRLRNLGLFTLVGKHDECLSACVLAFMGGERRSVAGRLGIHRPFIPITEDIPNRQARFRHLQKTLKAFIEEMDFPDSLYEAVMLVPPESIQMLTSADLKKFYLEGISPLSEDMADAASARRLNLSMAEYLKRKRTLPVCAFLVAGQGRCEDKVLEAAASGGAVDDPWTVQTGEVVSTGRTLPGGMGYSQGPGTSRAKTRSVPGS